MEQQSRDMVRGAKRIALEQEIRRLESQLEVSTEQLAAFEKEVEKQTQRGRLRGPQFDRGTNGAGRGR